MQVCPLALQHKCKLGTHMGYQENQFSNELDKHFCRYKKSRMLINFGCLFVVTSLKQYNSGSNGPNFTIESGFDKFRSPSTCLNYPVSPIHSTFVFINISISINFLPVFLPVSPVTHMQAGNPYGLLGKPIFKSIGQKLLSL